MSSIRIEFGPVKADIIVNETDTYIIEVTPRFHGEISTYYVANQVYRYGGIESWFFFNDNSVQIKPSYIKKKSLEAGLQSSPKR